MRTESPHGYGLNQDPTVAKNRSQTRTRMLLMGGVVFFTVLVSQKFIPTVLGVYFPEKHPASRLSAQADEAFVRGDYAWLIAQTDSAEVKRDGLTPDLLKKVVEIVYNDQDNGLTRINHDQYPRFAIQTGFIRRLQFTSRPRFYKDRKGRLFQQNLCVFTTGSGGEIQGLLGGLMGGTAFNFRGMSAIKPSQLSVLTPSQMSRLSVLGIKTVTYSSSSGGKTYLLNQAVDRQKAFFPSISEHEAGFLKQK